MVKELSEQEFRRMQLLQLEMIEELDKVCREHNINYIIYGGTLLGAVRHKGYIPWDDDADIAMLREDYEKFKRVCVELNKNICFFQDHETDPEYIWGYGKIRRTGTTYIRAGQEHLKYKTGVFIDVVPMDDVPKSLLGQILVDIDCWFLRKIAWSRVGKYSAKGIERIFYKIISNIPIEYVFKRLKKYAKKSKNSADCKVRILTLPSLGKVYVKTNPFRERFGWKKSWILDRKEYEFEGKIFWGPRDYDGFLKYEYNDYMTLPPEEDRVQHAAVSDYSF